MQQQDTTKYQGLLLPGERIVATFGSGTLTDLNKYNAALNGPGREAGSHRMVGQRQFESGDKSRAFAGMRDAHREFGGMYLTNWRMMVFLPNGLVVLNIIHNGSFTEKYLATLNENNAVAVEAAKRTGGAPSEYGYVSELPVFKRPLIQRKDNLLEMKVICLNLLSVDLSLLRDRTMKKLAAEAKKKSEPPKVGLFARIKAGANNLASDAKLLADVNAVQDDYLRPFGSKVQAEVHNDISKKAAKEVTYQFKLSTVAECDRLQSTFNGLLETEKDISALPDLVGAYRHTPAFGQTAGTFV